MGGFFCYYLRDSGKERPISSAGPLTSWCQKMTQYPFGTPLWSPAQFKGLDSELAEELSAEYSESQAPSPLQRHLTAVLRLDLDGCGRGQGLSKLVSELALLLHPAPLSFPLPRFQLGFFERGICFKRKKKKRRRSNLTRTLKEPKV